jgi:carboxyl-terminal processing protease
MWNKKGKPTEGTGGNKAAGAVTRKRVGMMAIAVLIFVSGMGVGSGAIRFKSSAGPASNDLPNRLDYSSVDAVYQQIRNNYDGKLTETQLLNGLKSGLATATNDPYTDYFTPTEAKAFSAQLNNSFSGVGAELSKDGDGNLIVVSPISGFPAEKAGLKAQDIITSINGESTSGMAVDKAVSKIRGKAGTKVTLDLIRSKTQQLSLTITRENITIPSVSHEMLEGKIGYIRINTFAEDTTNLIATAANGMKQDGATGIILDLRNNPGGLLDAAVSVSSKWLDPGTTVLKEKRGDTVVQTYEAEGDNPLKGIKTVVLVNQGSASASEITAGALHDSKAATIIGEKSFGKGVVQQLIPLKDGGQLKVTVASWYRPNGQNINKKGITPDQIVKLSDDDAKNSNDTQKTAAIQFLQKQ